MKLYFPIAKIDAERREVWGYASTEARDDQGEVVKREALVEALGDYMKFANIREMHQLSAVGVAKEATVDNKGLYIGAKIVDDQAWQKIVEGVYKGYSIGGQVTRRDPSDPKTITGLVLNEISLVDRPANPEAVFDYWKANGAQANPPPSSSTFPIQIWACGIPHHQHLGKVEALRCQAEMANSRRFAVPATAKASIAAAAQSPPAAAASGASYGEVEYADPGYQADGKRRYPIDTESHIRAAWNFINRPRNAQRYTSAQLHDIKARIIAAWKKKIDPDGPPSAAENAKAARLHGERALAKALCDVGHIARIILDLDWLQESLAVEAAIEGDDSPQPARLQSIIAELCAFLNALVAEETGEIMNDAGAMGEPTEDRAANVVMRAAGARGAVHIAGLCRGRGPKLQKLATAILAKAKHSDVDQALLDLAFRAVVKCLAMKGLLFDQRAHMIKARDALQDAGATGNGASALDIESPYWPSAFDGNVPMASGAPDAPSDCDMLDIIAAVFAQKDAGHQALMDLAHTCLDKLTDGGCCMAAAKAGARHSRETLAHLATAHDHLVAAGASCNGISARGVWPDPNADFRMAAHSSLSKSPTAERSANPALAEALNEILPKLDRLAQRVEEIARAPLPPVALSKGITAISKQQDGGGGNPSVDDLAAAFSKMTKEEQTLALIKASYTRPIYPPGPGPAKDFSRE
jgi:phage head maturation protease